MILDTKETAARVRLSKPTLERMRLTGNGPLDSVMNMFSAEPRETAAVLHGILAGRMSGQVDRRRATLPIARHGRSGRLQGHAWALRRGAAI